MNEGVEIFLFRFPFDDGAEHIVVVVPDEGLLRVLMP
jgi:hypothetical protein